MSTARSRLRARAVAMLAALAVLALGGCTSSSTTGTATTGAPASTAVPATSSPRGPSGTGTTTVGGTGVAPSPVPITPVANANYAWTQLAPDGNVVVRAIADDACPSADVDGRPTPMTTFAPPTTNFPHLTCQVQVPASVAAVKIGDRSMPTSPRTLDRIVVVGDIGCYLKKKQQQNCLDPAQFPAKQLSDLIAAQRPDLVVFVGDIYYSQDECLPANASACGGVPVGDNWSTWAYDFFMPYTSSLSAAPWIFARGNHESCDTKDDNGGPGWYQLLALTASGCQNYNDPYRVDVLDQSFVVFDSAVASDNPSDSSQVSAYAANFQKVHELAQGHPNLWFVDHRPLWATEGTNASDTLNLTLEAAIAQSGNTLKDDVTLILSGHMHSLGVFRTADGRPAQIVSGGGGTELDTTQGSFAGTAIDGTTFTQADVTDQFGFVQFDRSSPGEADWAITYRTLDQSIWKTCSLSGRTFSCQ